MDFNASFDRPSTSTSYRNLIYQSLEENEIANELIEDEVDNYTRRKRFLIADSSEDEDISFIRRSKRRRHMRYKNLDEDEILGNNRDSDETIEDYYDADAVPSFMGHTIRTSACSNANNADKDLLHEDAYYEEGKSVLWVNNGQQVYWTLTNTS